MSDSDRTIVLKMIRYCGQIEETHRKFQEDSTLFFSEEDGFIYRNAVSMPILQIGELSKKLSYQRLAFDGSLSQLDVIAENV